MNRVIGALDNMNVNDAGSLVLKIRDLVWGYKVNDLLVDQGVRIISTLKQYGKVMADPKLHDIPNTINNSLKKLIGYGADLVTVHCDAQFIPDVGVAKFLAGITVLTNFTETMCEEVYGRKIKETVLDFAEWAECQGYSYLVCSGKDLGYGVRKVFRGTIICPAIRPEWAIVKGDDQERIMTPKKAIEAGADLLVIGRPITKAEDPVEALERTNEEISKVGG